MPRLSIWEGGLRGVTFSSGRGACFIGEDRAGAKESTISYIDGRKGPIRRLRHVMDGEGLITSKKSRLHFPLESNARLEHGWLP